MAELRLSILSSLSELRAVSSQWDDLWARSEVTLPTLRAELVAQWIEQFAPKSRFRAVVVENQGQFVAALPLIGRKTRGFIEIAGLPANEWSPCGDLLLDPQSDTDSVAESMAIALDRLPWPLFWFDAIVPESSRWQTMRTALERVSLASDLHECCRVGWIPTGGDWQPYRESWTSKHRNNMGRYTRRLESCGSLQLCVESHFADDKAVEEAMLRGFQVEDRNWKGKQGSSVLRSQGMLEFLLRQAKQLARYGQLQLAFLQLDDRPIAFTYAWNAKGVFHGFKTGYDERFASNSPGQLLMHDVLRQLHEDPQMHGMDCLGPISSAIARWQPETYRVARLVVAPRRLLGRAMLGAYQCLAPPWRRLRRHTSY